MNVPNLEALVELYPWKPSLALFRSLEWRGIYPYRELLAPPVLDLGCGDGRINRLFLGQERSIGLDVEFEPLVTAKGLLTVVQGDACGLPFQDAVFGSVLSICAVEHLSELDTCLQEVARVLRPGGGFIATVPSADWKRLFFWNAFFSRLGLPRLGRRIVDAYDRRMEHRNLFEPDEWARRLSKVGLEPLAFDPFLAPRSAGFMTFLEWIFALRFPVPGFWRPYGTFYILAGLLRRLGSERAWKRVFLKLLRPFYQEEIGPDGVGGGAVLVARREDRQ